MNKLTITLVGVCALLFYIVTFFFNNWQTEKQEKQIYKDNSEALLQRVTHYKTSDSVNVSSVRELQMKVEEFKDFRASDMEFIKKLEVDRNRLRSVITAQTESIYELKSKLYDSIVYVDRERLIIDTLKCFNIHDIYIDFVGCINNNKFEGNLVNRDSLIAARHVVPKKFLGFLWKYGEKEVRFDIASKNPHTKILNVEYTTIRD
jgi:hypothetical protein